MIGAVIMCARVPDEPINIQTLMTCTMAFAAVGYHGRCQQVYVALLLSLLVW